VRRAGDHTRSTIDSHHVACSATVRDEHPAPWASHSFVPRDDPNRGIDPVNRRAPDSSLRGDDFLPRVGDLPHRGDELTRPSAYFTARVGEKQRWRPQLHRPAGEFTRSVVDLLPYIERIPRRAPHLAQPAP
jgi:hypothetical protein